MPVLAPFATYFAASGMVCTVDQLASASGVAMLRAGGTAADAAVAASAVLAVTTQHMCGMGGDLLAVIHPGAGQPLGLNASGRAGSGASPARLRAEGRKAMPATGDIRSVTIPGCVDGWLALHERFGRLPLAQVLEPARHYAASGFPATAGLAAAVQRLPDLPGASDYRGGGLLHPGDIVRRPGVARALSAVVNGGRDGFYDGEFGHGLIQLGRGEFREDDLGRPQADWVDPVGLDALGHRLWTLPPNSQGYLTLSTAWIADGLGLPADPADPGWAHLMIEAARQASYDRPTVLHEHADAGELIDPERLAPRRDAIDRGTAAALGAPAAPGGTVAICAVDRHHTAVSMLQSNAAGFGSLLIEPGTGIFLQNRGIGFSLEAGHPAEYGAGRRPPHTLSPLVVTRPDGSLRLVAATMGGDSQPQILAQLLTRLLVTRQSPAAAVAAGRWTLAGATGTSGLDFGAWGNGGEVQVRIEGHAPRQWDDGLIDRGHNVRRVEAFGHEFGHAQVIAVEPDHLAGASDPRPRSGAAAGY